MNADAKPLVEGVWSVTATPQVMEEISAIARVEHKTLKQMH